MSELCMGPYERHYYRLGRVIRDTVKQAQELLFWGGLHRLEARLDRYCGGDPVTVPPTFGEFCLSNWQIILAHKIAYYGEHIYPKSHVDKWVAECRSLRQAMYHRHLSPSAPGVPVTT